MILVAGGTGTLGTQVVRRLTDRGLDVRVLTRDPARASHLNGSQVEVMMGDANDPDTLRRAVADAQTVISAMHGFAGQDAGGPQAVDRDGNKNLIKAAVASGVDHVILMSIHGATPDHPLELYRMKASAERELRASLLAWTILRPTAYMETWARLIGEPVIKSGQTRVFGRGRNPINFVSAHDVARFVELATVDPALRGMMVEIGGPENLSMEDVVETFRAATGKTVKTKHVPLPMMRVMSVLMRQVKPALASQIQAGVIMDTADLSFDPAETRRLYPSIPQTTLKEVIQRDYGDQLPMS